MQGSLGCLIDPQFRRIGGRGSAVKDSVAPDHISSSCKARVNCVALSQIVPRCFASLTSFATTDPNTAGRELRHGEASQKARANRRIFSDLLRRPQHTAASALRAGAFGSRASRHSGMEAPAAST